MTFPDFPATTIRPTLSWVLPGTKISVQVTGGFVGRSAPEPGLVVDQDNSLSFISLRELRAGIAELESRLANWSPHAPTPPTAPTSNALAANPTPAAPPRRETRSGADVQQPVPAQAGRRRSR